MPVKARPLSIYLCTAIAIRRISDLIEPPLPSSTFCPKMMPPGVNSSLMRHADFPNNWLFIIPETGGMAPVLGLYAGPLFQLLTSH